MEKARILVVEDEGLVALAIKTSLEDAGYSVPKIATSAEEAVTMAGQMEPDLILMDIRLQGRADGIEAAERIKRSFHIPVIYLTAYSDEETLKRASRTEPFGYVMKPLDERALSAAVETALYKSAIERELRITKDKLETIIRCVGDGIVVAGVHGNVDYLNATARRLLKLRDEEDVAGQSILSLLKFQDGRNGARAHLPLQRVVVDGESVSMEDYTLVASDGSRLPIDLDAAPLRDENDSPHGIIVAFRDVTERRRIRELVNKELREADALQRSLIPSNGKTLGGIEMQGFIRPASFGAGDAYQFFAIDERHAGFYILDVVGHGVSAAAIAVLLHRLLIPGPGGRLTVIDADPRSPKDVVALLNDLFHVDINQYFFSICYGAIDLASREGKMVLAGHHPPLIQAKDGSIHEISSGGVAVGILPSPKIVETEFRFDAGDRLYLYSDGLVECQDPKGEQFGTARIRSEVERTLSLGLAAAVSQIENAAAAWRTRDYFDDDVALLALQAQA